MRLALVTAFLSANREGRYFDDPALAPKLVETVRDEPDAQRLKGILAQRYDFDLFEELLNPVHLKDNIKCRKAQAAAFQLLAARLIKTRPVRVGFGYSVGMAVLTRAAGAIDDLAFEEDWSPHYARAYKRHLDVYLQKTTKATILHVPGSQTFAEDVAAVVARDFPGSVFIKDYRPPSAIIIGGLADDIDRIFAEFSERYPTMPEHSLKPVFADSSHTGLVDNSDLTEAFMRLSSSPPCIQICDSTGQMYRAENHDPVAFGRMVAASGNDGTYMSAVAARLRSEVDAVIVIASEKVARITFFGLDLEGLPIYLADASTLTGEGLGQRLEMRDVPVWA